MEEDDRLDILNQRTVEWYNLNFRPSGLVGVRWPKSVQWWLYVEDDLRRFECRPPKKIKVLSYLVWEMVCECVRHGAAWSVIDVLVSYLWTMWLKCYLIWSRRWAVEHYRLHFWRPRTLASKGIPLLARVLGPENDSYPTNRPSPRQDKINLRSRLIFLYSLFLNMSISQNSSGSGPNVGRQAPLTWHFPSDNQNAWPFDYHTKNIPVNFLSSPYLK